MTRVCFFLLSFLFVNVAFTQDAIITPLKSRSIQSEFKAALYPSKRALTDTLKLPFFDDFTSTVGFPNALLWQDSNVYVNHHFAISPPTFGVATFDNLDRTGKPYRPLSGTTQGPSDTLTSSPINLLTYQSGLNTLNYQISDSIYLSFFYQAQGLGDPIDRSDSLVLKFKNQAGDWKTVWKVAGPMKPVFKQVLIGIKETQYLYKGFQFRLINYSKSTGNMNQWHVDYVRMKSSRNSVDTVIRDVAINEVPKGPLKWYESMPYNHFKGNPAFNTLDNHQFQLRNNYTLGTNVQYQYEVRNRYNQVVKNIPTTSARNVLAQSDTIEKFLSFPMDTLSGEFPLLRFKYTISPQANDGTPDDYSSLSSNNEYTKTTHFKNYFAYDDGSAEGGFGLDYGSLPNGPGYAAQRFQTFAPDTLRGISVFFNRSVEEAAFKSFSLMVWKNISEPPSNSMSNDVLLKKIDLGSTVYTDSINGFVDFIFDTAVYIPQGIFYIGWVQNTRFLLNVGYDNNYKYAHQGGRNPNLFFNLNGYWEKVSASITGAVMMRPIVGKVIKNPLSVNEPVQMGNIKIYPNPSGTSAYLNIESDKALKQIEFIDVQGRITNSFEIAEGESNLPLNDLKAGFYTLRIKDYQGNITYKKYIKND